LVAAVIAANSVELLGAGVPSPAVGLYHADHRHGNC